MEPPHARVEEHEGVIVVTFDRDAKRNAISDEMTEALWTAVRSLRDRPDLRVLMITARGSHFSSGIDLKSFRGRGGLQVDEPRTGPNFRRSYRNHHLLYDEIEAVEKPVVLAAQGHCFGAGLEMAVSCDFRLAAETATFALPEISLAVIPGSGGISRLTRLIGPGWARWLAMAGEHMDAAQALSCGLVHRVMPAEDFVDGALAFAHGLASLPAEALGVAKMTIDAVDHTDRGTARVIERLATTSLVLGEDFSDRRQAFEDRRQSES